MTKPMKMPDRDSLVDMAKQHTGLSDFGDPWLLENLDALLPALDEEAELTDAGVENAAQTIIGALSNRLLHVDYLKQHPEILDEKVEVAAVVVGLPRTGSTMMHRMLSAAPGMTGPMWWECRNYTPLPEEEPGNPVERIEAARQIRDWMVEHAPHIMSIHPLVVDQPDEEVMIMGQLFCSTMAEGTWHVPSYARWLMEHSRTRAYPELKQVLQSLQFQDKSRKGKKWVLKTPGHLMALDAVLANFPEAKIVMTHRDPIQTVPSYCSMMSAVYHMTSTIDDRKIGDYWKLRWKELLDLFMSTRKQSGGGRFIDVDYRRQVADSAAVGEEVLAKAGVEITPEVTASLHKWIEDNRRGDRAKHEYTLEQFGLSKEELEDLFRDYRREFIEADA